jgi:hypothetical protein
MERSRTMLMDFDIRIAPVLWTATGTSLLLCHEDIILLLADFTRVRSLRLTGRSFPVLLILNSLRSSLPVQSLSLCIQDDIGEDIVGLPDDLFGGNAPIRCLQFIANGHIIAPHWLLRGVTHFTSAEPMLPELLDALRQMTALMYFEFRPHPLLRWRESDLDKLRSSPIQFPQLKNLIVGPRSATDFMLLNQLHLLQAGAKKRLELGAPGPYDWILDKGCMDGLSSVVEAANGFQHIHLSGEQKEGWFRMWTGNAAITWEVAEFCIYAEWKDNPRSPYSHGNVSAAHLVALCDVLGAARVHRLVIDSPSLGIQKSYWWELLEKLPGIEELELYPASVDALGDAWKVVSRAPAVLPTLRRVRIVANLDYASPLYEIVGGPPTRRIVRLPNSVEGNIASFPEAVSAEKELENMSTGLLRLLQGLGRNPNPDSKKRKRKKRRWG